MGFREIIGNMKLLIFGNLNDLHTKRWGMWFLEHDHEVQFHHAPKFSLDNVRKLKAKIEEFKPHILHSHYAGQWGLMGYLTGFRPHVLTVHGSEVLQAGFPKKSIVKKVLQKADLVTTDSKEIYRILTGWDCKVKIVQWGLDTTVYKPCAEKTFHPSIISLRSLEPLYDIPTIVKAGQYVQKLHPDTVLEIYGNGSLKDEILGMRAKKVKLMGMAQPSSIPAILSRSWIYVSAAKSDSSICFSTAEAMSCKLPCVISDVAENREWITDGWTFPVGDAESLAERIIKLIDQPELRILLGQRNRTKIIQDFNVNHHMRLMENYYQEVIETCPKNPNRSLPQNYNSSVLTSSKFDLGS